MGDQYDPLARSEDVCVFPPPRPRGWVRITIDRLMPGPMLSRAEWVGLAFVLTYWLVRLVWDLL